MAIVKTLDIILRASTTQLDSDVLKARKSLSKLFDMSGLAGKVTAAVGGVLSLGAAIESVRRQFEQVEQIQRGATALGVTFAEMQRLTIAARLAEVEVSQLTNTIGKVSVMAAKASEGNKSMTAAFAKLGIDAKAFLALPIESKIRALALGFQRLEESAPQQRLAVGVALFGKQWQKVLPLLSEAANDLETAAKWSREFQLNLTPAEVNMIKDVNDAYDKLTYTISGIARRIAVQFAPALELLLNLMSEAIKPGTALNGVLRGIGDVILVVTYVAAGLALVVTGLSELFGGWVGQLLRAVVLLGGMVLIIRSVITAMKALYAITKAVISAEMILGAIRGMSVKQMAAIGIAVGVVTGAFVLLESQLENTLDKIGEFGKDVGDLNGFSVDVAGPKSTNQQSATIGSQAAFEQIYRVRMESPMKEVVSELKVQTDLLEQLKDAQGEVNDIFESGGVL